jgi:hypothetical protein
VSKKHFVALADVIREHNIAIENDNRSNPCDAFQAAHINVLADWCQDTNPRFNRARWLAYIAGTCGKNGGAIKR